jgi:hypothetical protein
MLILDCETQQSASESIAAAYGIAAREFDEFLSSFHLEDHLVNANPPHTGDIELKRVLQSTFGREPRAFDRVFWFHLTRARLASDFLNGIHPLTASLDLVWETIIEVFRGSIHESRLAAMRLNGVDDYLYKLKVGKALHAGLYAVLVKELATRPNDFHSHDYLRLPEIMEDICNGYRKLHGVSITETLIHALSPIIVKFWTPCSPSTDYIEPALYYLYCTRHKLPLSMFANTCFDGENRIVPPEQIVYSCRVQI